ncbi:hypothetical protein Phpb_00571 [Photorhabdus namnaonensis]|uniref:Uncharacterized protein n=1 Tax=Photorhabdus namnaonensis TaxID=1851568 RepID=A0A1B8YLK1_9GAMM|nr:hypothetical protein Phpb_00571 [Photorhabdus namnaonensis]
MLEEEFVRQLAEQFPKYEEVLMTIAQKLKHKGLQEGLQKCQEAHQGGLQKGEKRASLKIARALMDNGIDHETIMKSTGLSQKELEQIHH